MRIHFQMHLLLSCVSTRSFTLSGKGLILHPLFHSQRRSFLLELDSVIYLIPGATNSLLPNFRQFVFLFITLIKHLKIIDLEMSLIPLYHRYRILFILNT